MTRFRAQLDRRGGHAASCRFWVALVALLLAGTTTPAFAHLTDNFDRADNAAVGNGWIEKNAAAFTIAGNRASKQTVGTGYRDNLVYRPASEDVLNVEAAVEAQFTGAPGYAQIAVRVQSATVATADAFDGYLLYINNSNTQAILGRQNGTAFVTTLATLDLTTTLNTTDRFRLRLAARGTNPVQLDAFVERLNGVIWQEIGQASVNDAAANRIATAGSVAFSGYTENTYVFDNFTRVDLGATGTTNPAPTTAALSPTQANAGETGLTLVVYGSGFTTDSIVRWEGTNRTTTYISPSELEAAITTADLATPAARAVTVFNPTPGGGTSAAQTFTVINPGTAPPAITSLSPSNVNAGAAAFTLTVNGTGFNSSSVVRWNGGNRTTTFVSTTQLTAAITAADVSTAGSAAVTVQRVSDGAVSGPSTFTINAVAPGDFVDNFNRANSATLGNGWIEKTAAAFEIVSNEAARTGAGFDYRDNVVYRPAAEDALDVEAAAEVRFTAVPPGYPQVFVRGQSATIAGGSTLDAYLLYINSSNTQAVLARQRGSNYDEPLATFTLNPALNTTDRYRLRLQAIGTNPVQLSAFVERQNGTAWQTIGQATASDAAANRISTAGTVGFGGYTELSPRFDNFTRTGLGGSATNPVPAVTTIAPTSAIAGSGALTLTVNGSNFINGSQVRWNGATRTTTFISATQLQAAIPATDTATAGNASVTVFNPTPGGGTSGALTFSITSATNNPVPVATSLAPSSAAAGSAAFTLTVNGSNFVGGSVVRWNGNARTTTFVSATQITAAIAAADVAAQGTSTVTVFNPTPGGGTSGNLTFTVNAANNPVPTASSLSPTSTPAGGPAFTLTVNGTNFVGTSVVRWNGSNRTTTFVSATQLTAAISASDISSQGSRTVTVFNPTPGGGTSGNLTFTVSAPQTNNPVPVVNSTSPTAWPTGGSAFTLTVLGSSFVPSSVVHWNGTARTTTVVSANELRANITTADVAAAGLPTITVLTPSPGGGRSAPVTFFVQDGAIGYVYDNFNRANSANVGNNWTEKNEDVFSISNGEVPSVDTFGGFTQDLMYRPSGEQRLDMESSVEFRRLQNGVPLDERNYPQLHARVQPGSVIFPWTLDSYIFFIDDLVTDPARAMFAVTVAPTIGSRNECYISMLPLPAPLVVGERYRLRFRVSGTSPVTLWGAVDQYSNGAWTQLTSGTTTHSTGTTVDPSIYCDGPNPTMPPPITNPGVTGLAKWTNRTDTYDNWYVRDLAPLAPPPTLSSLSPSSTAQGGASFQLTVNGSGFQSGATVRWNGSSRTTTFLSATQLRATINASDIAASGTAAVTVSNPGSAESSSRTFTITSPTGTTTFSDNFDRTDAAALGNGWIEKTADAFRLSGNRADKLATPSADYRNNLVYRPAGEDRRDVEAMMEFRPEATPIGYPSLLARIQQATANTVNGFQGYMLFMDSSNTLAVIGRQLADGNYETRLAQFNLSTPLVNGQTYRMRLMTVGSTTVTVTGTIEQLTGGGTWTVLGTASATDSSAQRIANPGAVGFTGYVEDAYSFDNFSRVDLTP
jgi:hypothetical protein